MTRHARLPRLLIMDACVLIDFIGAAPAVLELVAKHIGPLHVTSSMVGEVKQTDEAELMTLGVDIVEPEFEDALAAAAQSGALSFEDWICLLTAKRNGFTCVTNDRCLRRACGEQGVSVLWGLELLVELCLAGGIPAADALAIAELIAEANPRHITPRILSDFRTKLIILGEL